MSRVALLLLLLTIPSGCHQPLRIVDGLELVEHPERYADETFTFDGYWVSGFECSSVVVPESKLGALVHVEPQWAAIRNTTPEAERWYADTCRSNRTGADPNRRVLVHFRGQCTLQSELPDRLDKLIAELDGTIGTSWFGQLRRPRRGFGHLSGSPLQLSILKLQSYEVVARNGEPARGANRE